MRARSLVLHSKSRAWSAPRRRAPGLWRLHLLAGLAALLALAVPAASAAGGDVLVLTVDGPLTQAMGVYIERGLAAARLRGAEAVVIRLNTPGGQIDVMDSIIQDIRGSSVPVIVFITPRGALAGSAGAIVTLAGHAAAMSPETAIGAASPVGGGGEDLGTTLEAKVKEATGATARGLAERRGPAAVELAVAMINEAKAVNVSEARAANLIDFVAEDTGDLLRQADGFEVMVQGQARRLETGASLVVEFPMSLVEQLLHVLTNPNVISVLLLIGAQSILIELSSPGGWVAGFIGVVCLALAFYGLSVLPVNWFGLIFIITAFVLFIMEFQTPTHGGLTIAALASLIAGTLILFNSPGTPTFERVSVPLVVGVSLVMGALFLAAATLAWRSRRLPVATGLESVVGQEGEARTVLNPSGTVQVGGELWSAQSEAGLIENGQPVQVVGAKGLRLRVIPKK